MFWSNRSEHAGPPTDADPPTNVPPAPLEAPALPPPAPPPLPVDGVPPSLAAPFEPHPATTDSAPRTHRQPPRPRPPPPAHVPPRWQRQSKRNAHPTAADWPPLLPTGNETAR